MELGFALPFLAAMLVGTMDFGRLFFDSISVASAVRAGLQFGTLNSANSTNASGIVAAATQDAVNTTGLTITTARYCQCADGSSIDCTLKCTGNVAPEIYIRVKAAKVFQTLLAYPGIPSSVNLSQQAVMRVR